MNEDLINSAVSFLKDPNVASSPLNKKVEFLETKGLNEHEIEEALKRANNASSSSSTSTTVTPSTSQPQQPQQPQGPPVPYDYYGMAPQPPERTWKDYFIMATATAGVTYGLYQVVIDADKEAIDEEFIKIDKVLEQLGTEQKEIKDANEGKLKEIDVVIDNINDFLSKYNKDKLKFDDDLRLMKLEVDNLKNSVEKNMKLTKDNLQDELAEITEELGSLKNLIKARSGNSSADNSGPRKVAPVSSIPSASEILKKAKNKSTNNAPTNNSAGSSQPNSGDHSKNSSNAQSPVSNFATTSKETRPSTPGNIFAAGIPEWQLKHKQAEEQAEKEKKQAEKEKKQAEAGEGDAEKPEDKEELKDSMAAWQQHTANENNDDEVVKKSIESVGVPAWQLSAGNN
ncbi:uncharacterized protein CXQ87_002904 [Candidozyma duobushaemuli]|uniref:Peroxisomal membrane protein PEX14 n=1 Tax=Candidozyma duobushaemuli TaxID=1231522 RepID=A0A2V1ABC8_9ASCO|nr:uncharacterized protein CXQ87_002904 [[Candida] duobushaemulonis]PVH15072.1 hypothetical protein CXQ87_002904 [[Candida] duobushaemulonis]